MGQFQEVFKNLDKLLEWSIVNNDLVTEKKFRHLPNLSLKMA